MKKPAQNNKLLFLAFAFPPNPAIGSVRCASMAKYLARLGWEVTVVTVDPTLLQQRDATADVDSWCRDAGVRRICTGHRWRSLYGGALRGRWWERPALVRAVSARIARRAGIDPGIGWVRPVLESCAHLGPADVDVILASGSPFPAFEAACRLGVRLNAPVVLDYRDLWSMGPHDSRRLPSWCARAERKWIKMASSVFVVSSAMAGCLGRALGGMEKISVATNGFDPDAFLDVKPMNFTHPTLVYAGAFYPPLRVIDPVLDALRLVHRDGVPAGSELRLLYMGPHGDSVRKAAQGYGVLEWVEIRGSVPRRDVVAALKGALAAVVITSVEPTASPEVDSILTGKLFEAMGVGTPILLVAPDGTEAVRVIERTHAGQAFAGPDVNGMAAWLRKRLAGGGMPAVADVSAYSWPEISQTIDRGLRKVVER